MALPFILLTLIPGLSQRLPKAGQWMDTFKQFWLSRSI
jgi:thiol:disulfide interchange protein